MWAGSNSEGRTPTSERRHGSALYVAETETDITIAEEVGDLLERPYRSETSLLSATSFIGARTSQGTPMTHRNTQRFDLSDRLVHFTKAVNREQAPSKALPEEWPLGRLVESNEISPFFFLREILRTRRLVPSWSWRKTGSSVRRTIYGARPAVCFAEMPLDAFLEAGRARSTRGEHMSPYGVSLQKDALFEAGARPVIYGLREGADFSSRVDDDGARRLPSESLPSSEQFRYVAFDPSRGRSLDWTHEREWRWPTSDTHARLEAWSERSKHALSLDSFEDIGFIVKTERQARLLLHDVLRLVDDERMERNVVTFILVHDRFPDPRTVVDPADAAAAVAESRIDLEPYFSLDDSDAEQLLSTFDELAAEVASELGPVQYPQGELGKCWLWLHDNTSDLARALIGRPVVRTVEISSHGHYLVNVPEFRDDTGLGVRERLMKRLAGLVESEFGTEASYYSVVASDDPDGLLYTDVTRLPDAYLNRAHDERDF